jgi:hypothetical protein
LRSDSSRLPRRARRMERGALLPAHARGWALNLALAFLAHSADNPQIRSVGRRTLRAVLS